MQHSFMRWMLYLVETLERIQGNVFNILRLHCNKFLFTEILKNNDKSYLRHYLIDYDPASASVTGPTLRKGRFSFQ